MTTRKTNETINSAMLTRRSARWTVAGRHAVARRSYLRRIKKIVRCKKTAISTAPEYSRQRPRISEVMKRAGGSSMYCFRNVRMPGGLGQEERGHKPAGESHPAQCEAGIERKNCTKLRSIALNHHQIVPGCSRPFNLRPMAQPGGEMACTTSCSSYVLSAIDAVLSIHDDRMIGLSGQWQRHVKPIAELSLNQHGQLRSSGRTGCPNECTMRPSRGNPQGKVPAK